MKEQAPLGVLPQEKPMHGVLPILVRDSDPQETAEWLSALEYVIESGGPERAAFLLERLKEKAFNRGVPLRLQRHHALRQHHPAASSSPSIPATASSSGRSRASSAGTRWRWWCGRTARVPASAATSPPTPRPPRCTRWPSTTSSAARTATAPGDQVFFQGHAAPGIYARAFLEGRLSEQQLNNFRRELAPGGGLSSYPHPWLMPDFWEFPTVSMGLGPIMAIYQARFNHYLVDRGIKPDAADSRVWAFLGDGECDEPETLGAITLAAREQLDNLIFVINCNLQRLDGPVRGNGKIIQELEGAFRGAGWNVIKVIWGSDWDPLLARDADGLLVRRMGEVVDGEYQKYTVMPGSYIREHFFGADPRLQAMVADLTRRAAAAAAPRRPRSGEGLRRLQGGRRAPRCAHGDPGQDDQGLRPGRGGRRPQHHPPAEEAQRDGAARVPQPLRHSDFRRAAWPRPPFYKPPDDSPEMQLPARAAQGAGRARAQPPLADGQARSRRSGTISPSSSPAAKAARSPPRWPSCGCWSG